MPTLYPIQLVGNSLSVSAVYANCKQNNNKFDERRMGKIHLTFYHICVTILYWAARCVVPLYSNWYFTKIS